MLFSKWKCMACWLYICTMNDNTLAQECQEPLGMESFGIPDEHITASSFINRAPPFRARLNTPPSEDGYNNVWRPHTDTLGQWIQVFLNGVKMVSGVITKGKNKDGTARYVSQFKIQLSTDGLVWQTIVDTNGNEKCSLQVV
ncbi:lactadherin-like [Anneissia japonica]|uniref:lactadherin-like n=1 Tax=Anneissia japonica TaxID=1529436 RepID=UPI0014255D78|nr:lactadherin-like [Anneissia japonica]